MRIKSRMQKTASANYNEILKQAVEQLKGKIEHHEEKETVEFLINRPSPSDSFSEDSYEVDGIMYTIIFTVQSDLKTIANPTSKEEIETLAKEINHLINEEYNTELKQFELIKDFIDENTNHVIEGDYFDYNKKHLIDITIQITDDAIMQVEGHVTNFLANEEEDHRH